jgi:ParB family chromosome partitioning protein
MSVRAVEEAVALASSEAPPTARRPRARSAAPAAFGELVDRLADRLETRVKVDVGKNRGKVTIEFATVEDLQRIVAIVEGPEQQ